MAEQTEYIFEKDFWGNWKLVPKKSDSGIGWIILFMIVVVVICIALITLPLWIALLGFKMVKTKRYYAGIGSLLALLYFIVDVQNKWITGFLFFGYYDSAGMFTNGLIGEKQIMYLYVANGIGIILGVAFMIQAYLLNKENNSAINSTSQNNAVTANSQNANQYNFSSSKPIKHVNQINLIAGVFGTVFAIALIYYTFNKKENNKESLLNNPEIKSEQSAVAVNQINTNNQNDLVEKVNQQPISQNEIISLITQFYSASSGNNFSAEIYFSDNVTQYINRKNLSPADINLINNVDNDFINGKSTIIDNQIYFDRTEEGINFYKYWIDFNCYRKLKNKYQSCKVKVEIGFEDKNKIKSYRELEVTDLKFTNSEPGNEATIQNGQINSTQYELGNYVATGDEYGKVYFHNEPEASTKRRAYIEKGDKVYVEKIQNGFGFVQFTNSNGQTSYGWVVMDALIQEDKEKNGE